MRLPRPPRLADLRVALRDPRRWRRWAGEAALLLAVLVGITLWQNRNLPSGSAPPLAGLRSDNSTVDLARQTAPTLVVFWATWCPLCAAEAGTIEAVAQDWPVLSVATQSEDAATVSAYLHAKGLRVPALIDSDGQLAQPWHVSSVPVHFIVDATGKIRFRVVGYATEWGLRARLWWAAHVSA